MYCSEIQTAMADSIENFTRTGSFRDSWRGRFHNKWPAMTTMMMKSESEIDYPNITPCPDFGIKSPSLRSWSSSNQDTWTDSRGIDNETTDGETCSQNARNNNRCGRTCNGILCVFMVLSVIAAACAGVGLAILLTQPEFGLAGKTRDSGDTLVDIRLEDTEMAALTAKFCNLVKEILDSVNFPIKKGIKSCDAVLKLMKESEGLLVEFHVVPADGYTLKEKFLRALTELVEERGRNGTTDSELNKAENSANTTSDVTLPKKGGFITFIPEVTIEHHSNESDMHRVTIDNTKTHSNLTDIDSSPVTESVEIPKGGLDPTDRRNVSETSNEYHAVGKTKSLGANTNSENTTAHRQDSLTTLAPQMLASNRTETMHVHDSFTTEDTSKVHDTATQALTENAKNTTTSTDSNSTVTDLKLEVMVKTAKSLNRDQVDNTENTTRLKHNPGNISSLSSDSEVSSVSSPSETRLRADTDVFERTVFGIKPTSETNVVHSIKRVKLFEVGKSADKNKVSTQNESKKTEKDFVAESLMKGGVFKLPMKTTSKFKFLFANRESKKD